MTKPILAILAGAADGVAYEVIVTKPGLPAQVPLVARGNAK